MGDGKREPLLERVALRKRRYDISGVIGQTEIRFVALLRKPFCLLTTRARHGTGDVCAAQGAGGCRCRPTPPLDAVLVR